MQIKAYINGKEQEELSKLIKYCSHLIQKGDGIVFNGKYLKFIERYIDAENQIIHVRLLNFSEEIIDFKE